MADKLRDLTTDEKEILAPLIARKGMATARLAASVRVVAATKEELRSLDVALAGMAAAFLGANSNDVALDLEELALYRVDEEDVPENDPVETAAAAARDLVDGAAGRAPIDGTEDPEGEEHDD